MGRTKDAEVIPHLTDREVQVLRMIWGGKINAEIAVRLKISIRTVEAHRSNVMRKWQVTNCAQLLRKALRSGLVMEKA